MTRNRASAKAAGARMERLVANYLAWELKDDRVDRRVKTGAKDRGDITGLRTPLGARLVVEVKDTAVLNLSGWLREATVEAGNDDAPHGVVVHKRRGHAAPADQYVLMDLETLAWLIAGGPQPEGAAS